jgi:DNA-binding CsgD family transcriptional regulator
MKEWILSPLEKACLQWIYRGRTIAEIAFLQGRSVAETEGHLQRALAALEARSADEALEKTDLSEPE